MTDNWSLKGKMKKLWMTLNDPYEDDVIAWFEGEVAFKKDIENLRQKLIEDVEEYFPQPQAEIMISLINRRFGVEEVNHATQ